jgi:DNA repair protein RadA/Sms
MARTPPGIDELDRVLGGGIVEGGVVLIGGDPASASPRCCCRRWTRCSAQGQKVLYVTGEESGAQVALRSRRLGLDGSQVQCAGRDPAGKDPGHAGRHATRGGRDRLDPDGVFRPAHQRTRLGGAGARMRGAPHAHGQGQRRGHVLVGHVTKEGALAGPRVLEHMVDTVLYFEGDTHSSFRLVRAIKNRFGAVNEIGVFAMTERASRA